ncbi:hypothetical protein EIP91_003673 [Steccherinum ochraceum]|uniref:Uncharacterized protein n=1 Tax=Steccherinum ochraceum TaxID=92696 RepID=A0A4R0RA42_9APHY|nr:hypothetical protein EIP91_003673 [Steccherinum ochraceum]
MPAIFLLDAIAIMIVQAIIVLRCWYLFQNSPWSRFVVLFSYIGTSIAVFVILGFVWTELKPVRFVLPGLVWDGCMAPQPQHIWRLFVPGIITHTILYGATTIPALRLRSQGKSNPIMNRVLTDGGAMYLVVFVTVMFSGIGAVSSNLNVSTPAMYSNFMLSACSVAVSRLILNMQSLAAGLSLDPKWLLNNAELSRVRWRKGSRDGELIVEVDAAEGPDEAELELGVVMSGKTLSETIGDAGIKLDGDQKRSPVAKSPKDGRASSRRTKSGVTTTKYGHYEDLPNMFYKGKGDTRP